MLLLSCFSWGVNAQTIRALNIGDKIPDVLIPSILNNGESPTSLKKMTNKALILDFWFIGCAGCIEAMPHLDSLQKEFANELTVSLVTYEKKADVEKFFATNRHVKNLKFKSVVQDSVLKTLFPAVIMPHQIWIDKNGVVKAITDGKSASMENVKKFLSGEKFEFVLKKDVETDPFVVFGRQPLILYNFEGTKEDFLQYSYFSKYQSKFSGSAEASIFDSISNLFRVKATNFSFVQLYNFAYGLNLETHLPTRLVREDSNPISSIPDFKDYTNIFCYDLIYKPSLNKKADTKLMIDDLDRFFGIKSNEEERKIKSFVIQEASNSRKYRQTMGDGQPYINAEKITEDRPIIINNIPFENVLLLMNQQSPLPVVNGTDYFGPISFEMSWNPNNPTAMSKSLEKYGLEIVVKEHLRKVIVLKDR